ncbi:hypothetical protein AWM68_16035 [Fictibacillus phosphorivorans]|uniref:DUF1189 domain-containing protein n=1 Tax=Fictibacillus phosphorivorans TaxID=1221500 RepID=A0A163S817_9BACL|nr:DUF1189 family protein [Fictibacillus phosphorivorans]KZE68387.1 hypothetical protein AWM68_16035 [Fictibacillus phosphorivorans]
MKLHIRFVKSLYSFTSIAQLRLVGVGSTILYVLLLTLLCIAPVLIVFLLTLFSDKQPLSNFDSFGLNPDQMQNFASSLDGIFPIIVAVIYVVMYVLFSGLLFTGSSILAGIAIPAAKFFGKRLSYRHLWVMSCYSITLPSVLLTILFTLNVQIPYSFIWFWLISLVICILAISKTPSKK